MACAVNRCLLPFRRRVGSERFVHCLVTAEAEVAEARKDEGTATEGCNVVIFFYPGHFFVGVLFEFWELLFLNKEEQIGTEIDNELVTA